MEPVRIDHDACSKPHEATSLFIHEAAEFLRDKMCPATPKNRIPGFVAPYAFVTLAQIVDYSPAEANFAIYLDHSFGTLLRVSSGV